jgi:HEPN domain-containing protein
MIRKRLPPDDPREWLNRARSNFACAIAHIPDAYLEDLCFNAQQCAEKAVKAVFICRGESFPFVHDLRKLLTLLEETGLKVPKYVWEAIKLSPYASVTRYPDQVAPVTQRQYHRAVRIAAAILRWAERLVERA